MTAFHLLRNIRNGTLLTVGLGIASTLNEKQGWDVVKGSGQDVWGKIVSVEKMADAN
jgi:hypothetical protein